MMQYIWPLMVVFSLLAAAATGNMGNLSSSIIGSGTEAINLAIRLAGMLCFWNGIVNIAEKSELTKSLCKLLSPILKILFPKLQDSATREAIAMNMTANLLGLDNAATPLGLEAMKRLQRLDPSDKASDNMVRFVVINTACLHIVPTTVALLRQQHGSSSPTEILLPALCTSICSISVGLLTTFLLKRFFK